MKVSDGWHEVTPEEEALIHDGPDPGRPPWYRRLWRWLGGENVWGGEQ